MVNVSGVLDYVRRLGLLDFADLLCGLDVVEVRWMPGMMRNDVLGMWGEAVPLCRS